MKRLLLFAVFFVGFIYAQTLLAATKQMWVGETYKCDATSAVTGLTSDVSWSTNGGYITLSGSGFYRNATVTQYFSGTATIRCSWKYRLYSGDQWTPTYREWTIKCNDNPCSISPTSMTLAPGESDYVGYSLKYSNSYTSAADVYYSSSNPNIAEVDKYTGKVTANCSGTTYVTCYSKVSANSPYCTITVKEVNPTGVSLPSLLTVNEGANASLSATLTPSNANTTFSWWSEEKDIATVSSSSSNTVTVKGKTVGNTKVYVRTANGFEDYCNVTVRSTMPTGLSITDNLKLKYGGSKALETKMTPSYAVSDITWESDNEDVATVNENGVVSAVGEGNANITATTTRGSYKAKCNVTVAAKPTHFVICFNDGKRVAYALEDNPKVINGDGIITVVDKDVTIEYPLENVHKYVLGVGTDYEVVSKIEKVIANEDGTISQSSGNLILTGFAAGSKVSVYNVNGVAVSNFTIGADGRLEISLSQYSAGMYIVKTQSQTFKFIKR